MIAAIAWSWINRGLPLGFAVRPFIMFSKGVKENEKGIDNCFVLASRRTRLRR